MRRGAGGAGRSGGGRGAIQVNGAVLGIGHGSRSRWSEVAFLRVDRRGKRESAIQSCRIEMMERTRMLLGLYVVA